MKELIEKLRNATGWENASEHYSIMKQAADAIEHYEDAEEQGRMLKEGGGVVDYIERNEAMQSIAHEMKNIEEKQKAVAILLKVPAADVRPVVHGKWIAIIPRNSDYRGFKCNKCGAQFQGIHRDNFCGNCGADMREVEHD